MNKKSSKSEVKYFVDGKETSLFRVVESTPRIWKSYIERHHFQGKSAHQYLESKLGDYLSAQEIHEIANIRVATLDKWRKRGAVKAEQLQNRWYYSVKSLLKAIKSADVRDLRS